MKVSIVSKMEDVPVPGYQTFWTSKRSTLKSECQKLVQQYPEVEAQLKQLFNLLGDIEVVAGQTPSSVGKNEEWVVIVNAAEEHGASYCKYLHGETF
jgi:hypothetical protein